MKDIYFNDINSLVELHELYYWTSGSEGFIYKIPNGRRNILIKLFFNLYTKEFSHSVATMKNKEQKVQALKTIVLPNRTQIEANVFLESQFIGYITKEAMHHQDFCFNCFSTFQQLEFLKKLKNQLQRFHQLDIVYGDLKSNNVLAHITNYKLGCLCDLDNMQVKKYPIDMTSDYVDEFLYQYGKVDENLDWYVLNLLTLEVAYGLDKSTYAAYTETRSFLHDYKGTCDSLKAMQHITSHYEGTLLLDDPNFYEEIGVQYYKKN